MKHELKILECYAQAKINGDKLFEIRDNANHGFQKGDIINYRVVDNLGLNVNHPLNGKEYEITYVTNYNQTDGWVVFGEKQI